MNIRRNVLIAASAIALAASPAFAGDEKEGEKMDPTKKFEAMDADSNGSLSKDEVKAHLEEKGKDTAKLDEWFAKTDADENGEISKEEWDAHVKAMEEKKEEKKEGDGGE